MLPSATSSSVIAAALRQGTDRSSDAVIEATSHGDGYGSFVCGRNRMPTADA
jgi:hypothetical protein